MDNYNGKMRSLKITAAVYVNFEILILFVIHGNIAATP